LYYRLKQVDYNGNFSFSKVILFDPKVVENGVILFDTKMKTIRLVGFDVDFIYFCICNALGQELFKGYLKSNEKEVNLNFLDQGIYIFSVYGRFIEKQSKKIIIE